MYVLEEAQVREVPEEVLGGVLKEVLEEVKLDEVQLREVLEEVLTEVLEEVHLEEVFEEVLEGVLREGLAGVPKEVGLQEGEEITPG